MRVSFVLGDRLIVTFCANATWQTWRLDATITDRTEVDAG